MSMPPTKILLPSSFDGLGGECGVISQLDGLFQRFISEKNIDQENQEWFSKDFSYFIRKLKNVKNDKQEIFANSCKIFDLFLEFVEKFGITQNLLKIIANFFDKHIHQSLTPFELDDSTENVLDVENLLKNPKHAEENNTVYFIQKMFSTNVFKMILDYVKSEDSDEVSLLHYLRIVRAIHIHVTNSVNSYIIKSMFKLIFDKELSANSNFIQIIEFIEHFSVFNVAQPSDIIEYLLKVMKTRSSYAGHILSKVLLFLTKCDKTDQLADIQECINWALLDTENQGVFNSIRQLMKKYKQYQLIIEKNITEILFNSKIDDSETIKTNLVLRAIKYYDFNATNFANALIEKPYHSSKLEIYLIEKVDKTTSAGLFNLFLKNATDKEIKTAKHYEKNNNLEYHILKAIETAEGKELDNLIKLIFHQKMNGPICTFIERAYSTGKNYQLADAFKPLLGNIKERQTFKLLFNIVCDRMKDGVDDKIFHYATYFIRDWISSGEPSWMQKIIEPLFLIDEIHMSDCLPTFLDSIFERFPQHVRTLNFLLKLVEQTVPVQHCYWLVNAVMNELRHDRTNAREISMFMEILFELLEDENTREAAIEMLYHTACINADAKENCLGVTRELVFEHREKVMTTHAVFNPWHTCNRIFLNVSKLYPVLKHYTITVDMPNGKDKVVNQREPITAMPITEDSEIRMRISNNERTDSNQKPPEMTSLAIQMIANFFDTKIDDLEKYAESSTKIQMILVMMGLSDSFFSNHKVDQSQKLIYPHYIHYIAKTKPDSLDALSILEQLGNDSFDPVSTATIVQGLDFLDDKFEVKLSLFRRLIFHQYQCVRKLCTTLIDFTNMQNKLVAMIHEAEVYPCRERCEEFFEILGTLDISKSIFNDAFKDLRQYENGENFDLAFIGLLQLIEQNDENFDLVFQRAFKRPPSDSSNGPFLISHYSRTMAYEWLMSPENREKFAEKCKIIPIITDEEPNTIKYTGHSGIKNIGATCYASVLIQAMNTMPRFVEKLFISNDEKMSRFVFRLRHLLAQVRFLRGAIIDPSPMLLEINNFSAQDQQDACETYSTFISKIDEFDKSILEPITGKLVRTNYSGKMPPSTKEEPFYYLSIRTKGVYNLQEGLKRSFTPETIYNVHLGNDEIGVVKTQFHVEQWPMYLPFMMQRYEYDTTTAQRIKLTNRIEFPIIFTADEINDLTGSKPPNNYELCAVIIHSGTAQSGHYIALVSANGSWYECNDGVVQEIDVSKISELAFGLHEPEKKGDKGDYDFSSMTAYMLFYRMKTEEATDNHVSISPKLLDSLEEEAEQLWPNFIFNSSDLCQTIYQMYNKEPLDEALAELYFLSLFKINASSSRINHVAQKLTRVSNDDSTMNAFFRFIDRNLGDNLYKIVESSIGESLIKQVQNYLSKSSEINHFVSFLSHWRMVKDDKEVFILKILKRMLEIEDLDWTQNELAVKSALKILNDVWRFEKTKLSSVFLKTANQLFKVYANNIECKHIVNNLCEMAQTEMFIPLIRSLKKEETLKMFLKVVIVNFPVILISQNLPDFVYRLIEETYEENSMPAELKDIREFAPGTVEPIIMQATNVLLENNLTSCKDFREGLIKLASLKSSSSTDKPKKRAPVAQPATPQQQQPQQQQQATPFTQQQLQAFYQQQILQQQQQFLRHQYMQQQQQYMQQQQQIQLQQQQQQQQQMILGIYNPQQQTILPAVIATPVIVQNQNLMQNQLQGQSIMQTQQINTQQQQFQNQVHINTPAKTQKRRKNSENEKNGQKVNTELLKIENPLYDIEERITIDPNPTNPPFNVEVDPNMEVYKPIQNLPLSVVAKDGPFNYNDGFFPQTIDPVPLESISNF